MKTQLNRYIGFCDAFWKECHSRTYEQKMDDLFEAKRLVVGMYALSESDLYYALFLALKHLRKILPLEQYPEYEEAETLFEQIKVDCLEYMKTGKMQTDDTAQD